MVLKISTLLLTASCLSPGAAQIAQNTPQAPLSPLRPPAQEETSKPHRTVAGTVINALTGEPIRRAIVRFSGPSQNVAFTGVDGRFQIEGLPEGQLFLSAQKPGFFDSSNAGVSLPPGVNETVLKLNPEAAIQGRIVDGEGEPIEGLQVELLAQEIVNGKKQMQFRGNAQTRENGIYRFDGLRPGAYFISTSARSEFGFQFQTGANDFPQQAYPARFYPNSPDIASAQPVELQAGEQAQADFTLSLVRAFTVTGFVIPPEDGFVSIQEANDQTPSPIAMTRVHRGKFRLSTIPSGSWVLTFHSQEPRGYAEQTITVGSSNLEAVQLQIQPLASIPVNIAGEGEIGARAIVQLIPKNNERLGNNGRYMSTFRGNPDQALVIENVPPGTYSVSVQPTAQGCVGSVSSGSTDLTQNDLIVNADSQPPINVTLRNDCATLSGTVHAESGDATGMVILLASSALLEPKITPIQNKGYFEFPSMGPGEYRVYAFSNIDGLEYANPEMLRDFTGQQISLAANQKATITVNLNVRATK